MEEELTLRQRKRLKRQQKAHSLLIDTVTYQPSHAYKLELQADNSEANAVVPTAPVAIEPRINLPKRQLSQSRNSILSVSPAYKQRSKSAKTAGIESPTSDAVNNNFLFARNISPVIDRKADSIKILLLGDTNVGKTAIILRYCNELKMTKITQTKETHLEKTEAKLFGDSIENKQVFDLDSDAPKHPKQFSILDSKDDETDSHKALHSSVIQLKHRKEKAYSLSDYEKLHESLPTVTDNDADEYEIVTGSTIGIDIKTQLINLDNRFFKVILWDTAGQERFRQALNPLMYKKTQGLILVYDITSLKSFQSLWDYWILEWLKNNQYDNGYEQHSRKKGRIYLLGNKTDLFKKREVTHEHVLKFMFKLESEYGNLLSIGGNFEVSCKVSRNSNSGGVEVAFERILQDLVSRGCYESDSFANDNSPNDESVTVIKNNEYSVIDLSQNSGKSDGSQSQPSCCF